MCRTPSPQHLQGIALCTVKFNCAGSTCAGIQYNPDQITASPSAPFDMCVCPLGHKRMLTVDMTLCDSSVCAVNDRVPCCKANQWKPQYDADGDPTGFCTEEDEA